MCCWQHFSTGELTGRPGAGELLLELFVYRWVLKDSASLKPVQISEVFSIEFDIE